MSKKKKPENEIELRAAPPEEVSEWSQRLAGLIESHKEIKQKAKAAAREFKTQLEANEEEQERLSRMILTRQEEVPLQRQMTLAEIEDRRRHELSLEEFKRESEAFDAGKGQTSGEDDNATPLYGSARDLAEFEASLPERTDSELFQLQLQCGKEGPESRYFQAVLNERFRREDAQTTASPNIASDAAIVQAGDAPGGNTIEGGLLRALHGSSVVWQQYRLKGATDAQMKEAIGREFGISGSSGGPGLKRISFKGGKDPAFWFDTSPPAKPTLKGKALIEKAREVLAVPQRKARGALITNGVKGAKAEAVG